MKELMEGVSILFFILLAIGLVFKFARKKHEPEKNMKRGDGDGQT